MRAFIKMNRWLEFIETHMHYSFMNDINPKTKQSMYVRIVSPDSKDPVPVFLIVTMDREIHLVTPMGESPFMESQEHTFKDLLDDDFVEYVKGEFD